MYKLLGFKLYLASLVLIRIPPFNPVLFISSFNSHVVARLLLLAALLIVFITSDHKKLYSKSYTTYFTFIGLYFTAISLSIFQAQNATAFLLMYKDIVFGILFFVGGILFINTLKKLQVAILFLLLGTVINICIESILYFFPEIFRSLGSIFYDKYYEMVLINYERGRYFPDNYDIALIPIYFSLLLRSSTRTFYRVCIVCAILGVTILAFLSNFRGQILVLAAVYLAGIYYLLRHRFKIAITVVLILIIAFTLGTALSKNIISYNILDRVLAPEEIDTTSIESRYDMWYESVEMAKNSPFLGVGLGNYYDNLPNKYKINHIIYYGYAKLSEISATHPHNIFFASLAETGLLGLLTLSSMFGFFIVKDIKTLKNRSENSYFLIVGFWSLFLFSLFDPTYTISHLALLWTIRVLLIQNDALEKRIELKRN